MSGPWPAWASATIEHLANRARRLGKGAAGGGSRRWLVPAAATLATTHLASLTALAEPSIPLGRDWALLLDGQLRPRGQGLRRDAPGHEGSTSDVWVSQRTRVGATLEHREGLALVVRLQNVSIWGEATPPLGDALSLYAANARLALGRWAELSVGRQELNLDQERLLGSNDFDQHGRSLDGIRLEFSQAPITLTALAAKARATHASAGDRGARPDAGERELAVLHTTTSLVGRHYATTLFLVQRDRQYDETRVSAGGSLRGDQPPFDYGVEAYAQGGYEGDHDVRAYRGSLWLSFLLQRGLRPKLGFLVDAASGHGSRWTSFVAPWASTHEHFGAYDAFVDLPRDTGTLGIVDFRSDVGMTPLRGFNTTLSWHSLRTMHATRAGAHALAEEFDWLASYEAMEQVVLQAGAALLVPSTVLRSLRREAGGRDSEIDGRCWLEASFRF